MLIKNAIFNEKLFIIFFLFIYIHYFYNNRIIEGKISIIIPTYNREKLIYKSIESVLNQTYKNLELLVIEDGSNDNTKKEIYQLKDNRIRYIKLRKNKGANYARNLGIIKSVGEYIAFLDSDDIYCFNKIEKQIKNIEKNKSNFDFCKVIIHINKSKEFNFTLPNEGQEKKF